MKFDINNNKLRVKNYFTCNKIILVDWYFIKSTLTPYRSKYIDILSKLQSDQSRELLRSERTSVCRYFSCVFSSFVTSSKWLRIVLIPVTYSTRLLVTSYRSSVTKKFAQWYHRRPYELFVTFRWSATTTWSNFLSLLKFVLSRS